MRRVLASIGIALAVLVASAVPASAAQPLTLRGAKASTYKSPVCCWKIKNRVSTDQQPGQVRAYVQLNYSNLCCSNRVYVYYGELYKDGSKVETTYKDHWYSTVYGEKDVAGDWYTGCTGSHTWKVVWDYVVEFQENIKSNEIKQWSYSWTGGC